MSEIKKLIGIDVGKSGAIVVKNIKTGKVWSYKMPSTPKDVMITLKMHSVGAFCVLEKVQGFPGQSAPAAFNFGKGYGWLEMALLSCEIPTETVTPQIWMKEFGLGTKKKSMSNKDWKNKLKAKAQQLYPDIVVTLTNSDALLLLEYSKRFVKNITR